MTARWLSLLLVLALGARSVRADDRAEAGKAFAAGQALDKKKQYAKAIDQYVLAFKLVQHENTAYNIAFDFERLGKLREAYEWYGTFVDMTGDTKERERVEGKMEKLRTKPSPIVVTSKPTGAQVIIDGTKVGPTPYRGEVNEGSRTIVVKLSDKQREERRHLAEFGERIVIDVTWETTPPPSGAGTTSPGAPDPQSAMFAPGAGNTNDLSSGGPGATATRTPDQVFSTAEPPPPPRLIKWFAGAGAGAGFSASVHEYVVASGGIQLGQSDLVVRVGDARRNLALEAGLRWRFVNASRFAMYAGFLWNYIGSVPGVGIPIGLRFDLNESETGTWALAVEAGARFYFGDLDGMDASSDSQSTTVFPVLAFLEMRR